MTSYGKFASVLVLASMIATLNAASQEFDYDTFRPTDFQKFYGRISDGKIAADQLN